MVGGGIAGISAAIEAAEAGQRRLHRRARSVARRARRPAAPVLPQALPAVLRAGDQLPADPVRPSTLQGLHPGPGGDGSAGQAGDYEVTVRLDPALRARWSAASPATAAPRYARPSGPTPSTTGSTPPRPPTCPTRMAFPMKYVIDGDACVGSGLLGLRRGLPHRRHRPDHGSRRRSRCRSGPSSWPRAGSPTTPTSSRILGYAEHPRRDQQRGDGAAGGGGRADRRRDHTPERRPGGQAGGLRAVRRLAGREPPAVLLLDLLPGLDQGGDLRAGPVPGLRGLHLLHRHPGPGAQRGLLPPHRGPTRACTSSRARWPRCGRDPADRRPDRGGRRHALGRQDPGERRPGRAGHRHGSRRCRRRERDPRAGGGVRRVRLRRREPGRRRLRGRRRPPPRRRRHHAFATPPAPPSRRSGRRSDDRRPERRRTPGRGVSPRKRSQPESGWTPPPPPGKAPPTVAAALPQGEGEWAPPAPLGKKPPAAAPSEAPASAPPAWTPPAAPPDRRRPAAPAAPAWTPPGAGGQAPAGCRPLHRPGLRPAQAVRLRRRPRQPPGIGRRRPRPGTPRPPAPE